MILNELANQVKRASGSRARDIRRSRTTNLAIGAGIGAAVGVTLGVLFAPKSGKETRQIIAERTSETVENLREDAAAAKDKIYASVTEKGALLREAGHKGVDAVKETLEKTDEGQKVESKK